MGVTVDVDVDVDGRADGPNCGHGECGWVRGRAGCTSCGKLRVRDGQGYLVVDVGMRVGTAV